MTYHQAMAGKLVGIGQVAPGQDFPINNATVSFLAQVPCDQLKQMGLSVSMTQLLAATFVGVAPEGVSQQAFDAFTLRALSCDLYRQLGSRAVDEWLRAAFPVPDCLDDETIRLLGYRDKHGYEGPDREKNMLAWLMSRSFAYEYEIRRAPPCSKSCHNVYQAELITDCLLDPVGSPCGAEPRIAAWMADHIDKPLCPTYGRKVRDLIDTAGCSDMLPFLPYCMEFGYDGPNPQQNAVCWTLSASGRLDSIVQKCAPAPSPAPTPPAPAPVVSPTPTAPLAPTPLPPEATAPDATDAPLFDEPASVFAPPAPPPPAEPGMSRATMGILGILGLAAVGGVVYAARKRRTA